MTASEIKRMYLELGGKVFSENRWWRKLRALFDPEQLRLELHRVFGDRTLGDPSIHTGLCIIAKRADTGSIWPLLNHPAGAGLTPGDERGGKPQRLGTHRGRAAERQVRDDHFPSIFDLP